MPSTGEEKIAASSTEMMSTWMRLLNNKNDVVPPQRTRKSADIDEEEGDDDDVPHPSTRRGRRTGDDREQHHHDDNRRRPKSAAATSASRVDAEKARLTRPMSAAVLGSARNSEHSRHDSQMMMHKRRPQSADMRASESQHNNNNSHNISAIHRQTGALNDSSWPDSAEGVDDDVEYEQKEPMDRMAQGGSEWSAGPNLSQPVYRMEFAPLPAQFLDRVTDAHTVDMHGRGSDGIAYGRLPRSSAMMTHPTSIFSPAPMLPTGTTVMREQMENTATIAPLPQGKSRPAILTIAGEKLRLGATLEESPIGAPLPKLDRKIRYSKR